MKIAKRLLLIGVIIIVLSMTMATQYTSTSISYRFSIVHPSDSDIRFIGSDNSTDDIRVLRISGGNVTGDMAMELRFGGNIKKKQNKTYTAAFGIVNEEDFSVNITHINVSTSDANDYIQIWLHGNRDELIEADGTSVKVWDGPNGGAVGTPGNSSSVWLLGAGNHNSRNMCADANQHASAQLDTLWDSNANVRVSTNDVNNSVTAVADFVWVQISINAAAAAPTGDYTGTIFIFTRAGT